MRKFLLCMAIIIAVVGIVRFVSVPYVVPPKIVSIGTLRVRADVATDVISRERGLSRRTELGAGEGMLFVFEVPGVQLFWMKEMNFPIDIVWIDEQKKIVGVTERAEPGSYPSAFSSVYPVRYVLEIGAGEFAASGARVGSVVTF